MRQNYRSGIVSRSSGQSSSVRDLLDASTDFTYLGKYNLAIYLGHNSEDVFGKSLTHRYVNGTLRLIFGAYGGGGNENPDLHYFRECTLPGSYDSNVVNGNYYTTAWVDWNDVLCWGSMYWDEGKQKLWTSSGFDYPQGTISTSSTSTFYHRSLPSSTGVCTNHSGFWGHEGIGQRASFGKVQKVPAWAQSLYGFKEYIHLGGGYTSLMSQGLTPSMGPMFFAFDDPSGVSGTTYIGAANRSTSNYQILADHRSGAVGGDWYAGGYASRTKDRGVRITDVTNYMDGGDDRQNPPTRPDFPPVTGAQWLSPATGDPDNYGRWTWSDSYLDTGLWIDNDAGDRTKHGIITIPSLVKGYAWYQTSAVEFDGRTSEIHVFDPADLNAVKNGSLEPWEVRPTSIVSLESVLGAGRFAIAATFDSTTNRLYVRTDQPTPRAHYLHVFQVGGA